jgi:hypothetical protein
MSGVQCFARFKIDRTQETSKETCKRQVPAAVNAPLESSPPSGWLSRPRLLRHFSLASGCVNDMLRSM